MELSKENLDYIFETDIDKLLLSDEVDTFIEQNHFGDMLIEETSEGKECFKLWRNLECNNGGVEIEYCGRLNGYRWETVLELF